MSDRPLAGVRVLDLSRLIPGPFCSLVLSDLGASIDKLEDPRGGDYLRTFPPLDGEMSTRFAALNRDKRSIVLDLKHADGALTLRRLIRHYDVIIEGFRPGVMERLGCGYATLSEEHPRLIWCSISGYGQTGPYAERAGHDLNYLAIGGVLAPQKQKGPLPVQVADFAGGALYAAIGITAALYAREKTGKGRVVDVSMCEGAMSLLTAELRSGGDDLLTGGNPYYAVYQTSDGRHLSVAPLEPSFREVFRRVAGDSTDLAAVIAEQTLEEWTALFAPVDACVEPVLTLDELATHPQHVARKTFFTLDGRRHMTTPLGDRARAHSHAPRQGEHTAEILREAGFSDAEIAALT